MIVLLAAEQRGMDLPWHSGENSIKITRTLPLQMKFFNISLQSFCTLAELFTERREAFAREKKSFIGYSGEKKVSWRKSFHRCIMQSKILHSTQFVFLHSQLVNQKLLFPSPSAARSVHKTFIYCNWCFQWRKYEIIKRFCQFNILQLSECYSTFSLPVDVIHGNAFFERAKKCTAHQIFTRHITEWNKWNKSKI